ncbi:MULTISPECIES: DUF6124 family protein [unclassified Pseudomonas]|uniref:DUF6124 family protein n=1 Tax=unclassified Pseudomonas TaxID=196821 RepID=UPI0021157BE6|nr:DUF6124 family protein [Pseudomonas sp. SXM-1]
MVNENTSSSIASLQAAARQVTSQPADQLFTLVPNLDSETLLANASQDLASVQALTVHLAFEVDGSHRDVALGICRMLEGIQMMVDRMLDLYEVPEPE